MSTKVLERPDKVRAALFTPAKVRPPSRQLSPLHGGMPLKIRPRAA